MKKQLLIAAVAASMTSVAMADISITGAGMVKFVSTDAGVGGTSSHVTSQEMDLKVTGKSGDTTVVMAFDMDGAGVSEGDQYLTTSIAGVSLKAGYFIGGKSNLTKRSSRADKISASYTAGPVKLTYENNATNSAGAVYASGSFGGVDATFKAKDGSNEVILGTDIAGISIDYRGIDKDGANLDMSEVVVAGTFGGVALTFASASADSLAEINGDGIYGDLNGSAGTSTAGADSDITAIQASTSVAGNTVTVKNVKIDATGNDTSTTSVTVGRSLAAGTALTAKYTMKDVDGGTASDTDALELKLTVSF